MAKTKSKPKPKNSNVDWQLYVKDGDKAITKPQTKKHVKDMLATIEVLETLSTAIGITFNCTPSKKDLEELEKHLG